MKNRHKRSLYEYMIYVAVVAVVFINITIILLQFVDVKYETVLLANLAWVNCAFVFVALYFVHNKNAIDKNKIQELAYRDFETNLYNMNYLNDNFKKIIKKLGVKKCAYLAIDINNFKLLNNVMGYDNDNEILMTLANAMSQNVKDNEVIIRISGDIFGMIIGESKKEKIEERVKKIFDSAKESIVFSYKDRANVSFSCGAYVIEDIRETVKQVSDRANIARRAVKNTFGKDVEIFGEKMKQMLKNRAEIEEDMKQAIDNEDFKLYLQPKINMKTGKIFGAEALVRWEHKTKGMLSPAAFIPIFEENGFILNLDYYMFENVCKLKRKWLDEGKDYPVISVNMSRLHIYDKNYISNLLEISKKYDIPTEELEIEVTENAFYEDAQMLLSFTEDMKKAGFKLSIDDFGSGYSSLNMLKDINADVIKIDREFLISTDENDGKGRKILRNIISMAKELNIDIVTEGVENLSQIELLTNYGCEIAQGFYYAKPMSVQEFEKFANAYGKLSR